MVQRLTTHMWHPAILMLFVSLACEKAAAAVPKCKFDTIQGDWKLYDTCYLETGKERYKARDGSYYVQQQDGTYQLTEDGNAESECRARNTARTIWPGCVGKLTRHAHRNWSAWYRTLLYNASVSDIKVHVYRDPPFNWLHPKCTSFTDKRIAAYPHFKHSDDYYFARQAKKMPSSDPANATIFLIPAFLNMYAAAEFGRWWYKSDWHKPWRSFCCDVRGVKLCHDELVDELGKQLSKSPWFKRRGGVDHLFVASHWHHAAYEKLFSKHKALAACSQINFENTRPGKRPPTSVSLRSTYIGKYCPGLDTTARRTPAKHVSFHFIGDIRRKDIRLQVCSAVSMLPQPIQRRSFCVSSSYEGSVYGKKFCTSTMTVACTLKTDLSKNYCDNRRKNGMDVKDLSNTKCFRDPFYCNSLNNATFVLHIPGDTMGANRLWDAIDNGKTPIFIDPREYDVLPFPGVWRNMSLLVPTNYTGSNSSMAKGLMALSSNAMKRWSELRDALVKGKPIVSWSDYGSVTLRAYVRLLVDRINGLKGGPCARNRK